MKMSAIKRSIQAIVAAGALASAVLAASRLSADEKPAAEPVPLAKQLLGTSDSCRHAGQGRRTAGLWWGGYHFYTGKHWLITQADPNTGVVIFHHGGTYTLDGDKLDKTVEYANENTASLIKQTHHFTIKIEGDTLNPDRLSANPWNEVWKRVK